MRRRESLSQASARERQKVFLFFVEDGIVAPDVPVIIALDVADNAILLVVIDTEADCDGQTLRDGHHGERGLDICLFHNANKYFKI